MSHCRARAVYGVFLAACWSLAWLGAGSAAGAEENPAMGEYRGIPGVWLDNGIASAFVSGSPYPRVLAFQLKGGDSPMRAGTGDPFVGLRTWFMEPKQDDFSLRPSQQPAEAEATDSLSARLTAAPDPESGLRLGMEIVLDKDSPTLRVRHGLTNLRAESRVLSLWPILAFPRVGVGFAPWSPAPGKARSWLLFDDADPRDPSLAVGRRVVATDFRIAAKTGQLKTGVISDAGWVAYRWPGGMLRSSVPFIPGVEYPEGGANITFYHCGGEAGGGFCEIENVGPLTRVDPGETLWMDQTLVIEPADILPPVIDADALLPAIP